MKEKEIDFERLNKACQNTFKYRNTNFDINSILRVLSIIKDEKDIKALWVNYQKRFNYAKDINFDDVITTIIELVEKMEKLN